MNCTNFLENIIPYLDDELTQTNASEFEKHLHDCLSCNTMFKNIANTYAIIDLEKNIPDNPFFYHTLISKLEVQKQDKPFHIIMQILKPLAVAASITLGIIIGNGELDVLGDENEGIELAVENINLVMPADYSVWSTLNEDNGSEY